MKDFDEFALEIAKEYFTNPTQHDIEMVKCILRKGMIWQLVGQWGIEEYSYKEVVQPHREMQTNTMPEQYTEIKPEIGEE